jgi:hypothetical protein
MWFEWKYLHSFGAKILYHRTMSALRSTNLKKLFAFSKEIPITTGKRKKVPPVI